MDTTPPEFSGTITVSLSGDFLITNWGAAAFSDSEELFQLDYQFAIGKLNNHTTKREYEPFCWFIANP